MKNPTLSGKTIVVGVSGSIAAYKALSVVKELQRKGARVEVILTQSATELVDPLQFTKVIGRAVYTSLFDKTVNYRAYLAKDRPIEHISLADTADLILVCPATANIIAKTATGLADDLLSTTILATAAPVVFCPAMNVKMWKNIATRQNVALLKKRGFYFVDPQPGLLACGYYGVGRLAENRRVIRAVTAVLDSRSRLKGCKVVVTAGAIVEYLDAIRFIGNPASGKMGKALAEACFLQGARVVLIKGRNALSSDYHLTEVEVETGRELLKVIREEITDCDIFFHTAAISDFANKDKKNIKVKSDNSWHLFLVPAVKIVDLLRKFNKKTFIVAFKAEYKVSQKQLINSAYQTLKRSKADLIVANDIGRKGSAFGSNTNKVYMVDKDKKIVKLPLSPKYEIAQRIVDCVLQRRIGLND